MLENKKPPLVSIVGKSGVGKTYLLERVIPELKKRGYKIVVIKHHPHEFEIDIPGKDTWRYLQAGSDAAIISGPEKIGYIKKTDHDYKLNELRELVGNHYDIIITEGFKKEKSPKIEVHRAEFGKDLVCNMSDLMAVITDEKLDIPIPQVALDDYAGIASFIENKFLKT